ncbi:hypothetical protein O9992_12970 [Vibrio lentus]|nr:hypothetical protein [Vibrio lentus]
MRPGARHLAALIMSKTSPDYTSPWARTGGAATSSASCEESYLALHGDNGDAGEPEDENQYTSDGYQIN